MSKKKLEQTMNSEYDIMIVGGGPAGFSTWLYLHKHDPVLASKAVLIEKETYPRDKLCGGALHKLMTNQVFSDLGVTLDIPYVPVDTLTIRLGNEEYTHQEEGFFRVTRRIEFDQFLAQIAKKRGLQVRENEACLTMQFDDERVIVQTNKGIYSVKMLIGADGALSTVRRNMKPPRIPRYATTFEVFSPAHRTYDPEFESHTALMDFTPVAEGLQGYVWHFPCLADKTPFMNHGLCDTRINADAPRCDLKKIFSQELRKRFINLNAEHWSSHPVTYFLQDVALSQPHILLVGDAAGIEPLLGGGIHLSLVYGQVAATTIIDAVRRDDFSFDMYSRTIQNHYLGKYIKKFTRVASDMYRDKTNILDSLSKIIENKP